ncbi:SRPBCC family protein [Mycolicibacterium sp. YH-1]|uniref:SRPBCC family protein n=1 Tax=Mycolicibacterium sp. YH-1 TaxID=2908837 RepID=UPI001F4C2E28|nr:SRPBCC family protein [Mycolicibacterium sp. YH-1]UNB53298.1 SRPBCC family protein [Mycolicibacterium sp. YH-1]
MKGRTHMTDTGPADAAPLVNRAIRRDVARALTALTQWPHPDDAQRRAIAEHLVWMLKPIAREETPAAAAAAAVISAARRYADDAAHREEVADALGVLAPLLNELRVGMPTSTLALPWLVDDAPTAERHALGVSRRLERAYRRRTYRCWYLPEHCGLKRNLSAHVSVDVNAPTDAVWRVISDPTRTAEWSHECNGAQFLDGATESGLGVRFKGVNRSGRTTWSRVCTIFAFEPGREFGYVTSSGTGDATAWHFRVSPTPTGARLEQAFQTVALPAWMSAMVGVLMPSHDDRTGALREDMRRAGALAELYHRTQSSA